MLKVKKEALILTAGVVWLLAGFNVARLGVIAYRGNLTLLNIVLSCVVFLLFGLMFFRMSQKHVRRILAYEEERHSIFRFFDAKAYIIMCCMMTGGIWLRNSGLAPVFFIAFFYTGLGVALMLAGVVFLAKFFSLRGEPASEASAEEEPLPMEGEAE